MEYLFSWCKNSNTEIMIVFLFFFAHLFSYLVVNKKYSCSYGLQKVLARYFQIFVSIPGVCYNFEWVCCHLLQLFIWFASITNTCQGCCFFSFLLLLISFLYKCGNFNFCVVWLQLIVTCKIDYLFFFFFAIKPTKCL